jgi:hypothetical protein
MAVTTDGLKEVLTSGGFQKIPYRNSSSLSGNELLYTYASKTKTSTPYANLFKSFNFPITQEELNEYFNLYNDTALKHLNVSEIVVVEIPKGKYGELIDGKTFKLTFPVTLNSVATSTTVYGTYFGFDGQASTNTFLGNELNKRYTEKIKNYFGFEPTVDNGYQTNVTFLYSNNIAIPQDKGTEITILTSTTVTVTGNASNKYNFSTVILNTNDEVKIEYTLLTQGFDNVAFTVGDVTIDKNSWFPINTPGISSLSLKAHLIDPLANDSKTFTIEVKVRQLSNNLLWNVWSSTNQFPIVLGDESKKIYASYNGVLKSATDPTIYPDYDKPVGILYQDKGFAVITDPTLVAGFRYTAGTSSGFNSIASGLSYSGNIDFAKIYFTSNSNCEFDSITTEFVQSISCIAGPNEFGETTNSTYQGAYIAGEDAPTFITSIGLYNQAGELIGIGKLSEPVKKLPSTIIPFNIRLIV